VVLHSIRKKVILHSLKNSHLIGANKKYKSDVVDASSTGNCTTSSSAYQNLQNLNLNTALDCLNSSNDY